MLFLLTVCDVKTYSGMPCVIPYKYKGQLYQQCNTVNNGVTPWCSTSFDYDTDGQWGNCDPSQGNALIKYLCNMNYVNTLFIKL